MKERLKDLWCLVYAIYAVVGDWMVDQVDHNDYLAGFLCAFLIYAMLVLGSATTEFMAVVWNR